MSIRGGRAKPEALLFDVFGTLVDWRSSIARQAAEMGRQRGVQADWTALADAWRSRYRPSMDAVRTGSLPWMNLDALHRRSLDEVLAELGITEFGQADREELARSWHRLDPWPDARPGLLALARRFTLATLSNGSVALLTNLVKRADLPFDCILSAELFRAYKPDPAIYRGAAQLLGLPTGSCMMVAAHEDDLRAAAAEGMSTALVVRPREWGASGHHDEATRSQADVLATDLEELARKLEALRPPEL
jgi:2-haloacid dehalogenase